MLSPKARAFSVDQLLSRKELQQKKQNADDKEFHDTRSEKVEDLCRSLGEEKLCHHQPVIETKDDTGELIKVELCQNDLWQAFHRLGTEMIITKTGRRMFPAVRVRISGLKPQCKYRVAMDFIPVDKNKYRYVYHSSRWMVAGHGDTLKDNQSYEHPESPMTGEYMTSQVMSFEKIKLTNHETPSLGQVSLLSMQKFQPRITIEEVTRSSSPIAVTFPQTAFIAVTAYQNQEITRLKIARNPFAKGFREAGKCRSSLEAMMASFGVLIEQGNSPRSSPTKRKLSDASDTENDRASPQTKKAITSNSCYDRYMLQYPQTLYPTSSLGYQRGTGVTTTNSVIKSTYTKSDDHVKNYHTDDGRVIKYSSAHTSNVAMTTANSDHPAGVQICLPSSDIHPAFRLYPYTQFPAVFDPSYLSASYKTLAPFSALQGMVVLPSSFMQVPLSSNGMDKNSGGIHCKNADSIEICNT